jgi:hypothetical protein
VKEIGKMRKKKVDRIMREGRKGGKEGRRKEEGRKERRRMARAGRSDKMGQERMRSGAKRYWECKVGGMLKGWALGMMN